MRDAVRLVMTLLVRDEEDVLPANLAFHLDQGVDFFVITDHRSTDATPQIIRQYELAGLARRISERSEHLDQAGWVTDMARLAAVEHGADWVINNDADEFWWPRSGNLASTFADLDHRCDVVVAPRHDFVALTDAPAPFHRSMTVRKSASYNVLGAPLPPKVAHRGDPDVVVAPGNHRVVLPGDVRTIEGPLEVLHYPFRTRAQFIDKIVSGTEALERHAGTEPWVSSTWRYLSAEYERDGLTDYFRTAVHSEDDIEQGLCDGSLVVDRRLADHLDEMATRTRRT